MYQVFISYSSRDEVYARKLYESLRQNGISAWYARVSISGGENFAAEIGQALQSVPQPTDAEENVAEKNRNILGCQIFIALLSNNYMKSEWCTKEFLLAVKKKKSRYILRIDHAPLTDQYEYMTAGEQRVDAYHLSAGAVQTLIEKLLADFELKRSSRKSVELPHRIYTSSLHMKCVAHGDPFYQDGQTLRTSLSPLCLYLAPPSAMLADGEASSYITQHKFVTQDVILDTSLADVARETGISDLAERIEYSREKIFRDFLAGANGCYFNNKKYGLEWVNPFGRSEDAAEVPELELRFFTTDYFTHRVMKDVCKTLCLEQEDAFFDRIDFTALHPYRIFLTSLGINLLLFDTDHGVTKNTLLTCRSTNASETYGEVQYSLSVVEGVSLSDYDAYTRRVSLSTAVERGLKEELGIDAELLRRDSLRFYDLFINKKNLEFGLSCSVELRPALRISSDVLQLRGRDDGIEIAEKLVLPAVKLHEFIFEKRQSILPQAVYSIGSYLDSIGKPVLTHEYDTVTMEEQFLCGKKGPETPCGDLCYRGGFYYAVVDGATPKSPRLWNGKPADVFVAELLVREIASFPADLTAAEAITRLNEKVRSCYDPGEELPPAERLQASVLIYSCRRKEIWAFGDCQYMINGALFDERKKLDRITASARSLYIELALAMGASEEEFLIQDDGRKYILPLLEKQSILANSDSQFGYPVLDGGTIHREHIKITRVKPKDHVVLASDGYPVLCDTLAESEKWLARLLAEDPLCIHENRQTKALAKGQISYDDRCYLSFVVK